jgi:ABC-type transport system substrate-binding protein
MKRLLMYITLGILIVMPLLIGGISSVQAASGDTFIVGEMSNPQTFDPAQMYDMASYDAMIQFLEGLYRANTSSDNMETIPALASAIGTWSTDKYNYTVPLRTGVRFSDGMPFNASCVKWNFDRVLYLFVNDSCSPSYQWTNGVNWILNRTEVVSNYEVKFILNFPSVVWEKVLTLPSCYIISPISAAGYEQTKLGLTDIDIIKGTGPWTLDSFTLSQRLVFSSNPTHWRGEPQIKNMIFQIIKDVVTYSQAILDHAIHFGGTLPSYYETIDADTSFTVEVIPTTQAYYITYNVDQIPKDVRYAMSTAIDYPYIIEGFFEGFALELHTPIFKDIQYHNASIEGLPYYNVTLARNTLLDSSDIIIQNALTAANLDETNDSADWVAVANSVTPLFEYNLTRWDNSFMGYMVEMFTDNFKQIGIKLVDESIGTYNSFLMFVLNPVNHHRLQLTLGGVVPDYNEPTSILEQLFRTDAQLNTMELDDSTLNLMLDDALTTPDGDERAYLMWQIQEKIAVEICPITMLWQFVARVTWYNKVLSHCDSLLNPFLLKDFYECVFTPIPPAIPVFEIIVLIAIIGASVIGIGLVSKKFHKRN